MLSPKLSPSDNSIIEVPSNWSYIQFTFKNWIEKWKILDLIIKWIIIPKLTVFTLKTINYSFRSTIGIKMRNDRKIIQMNRHGQNFIAFGFNLIKFLKKIWIPFQKKILYQIDSVNSMYDPESQKVYSYCLLLHFISFFMFAYAFSWLEIDWTSRCPANLFYIHNF